MCREINNRAHFPRVDICLGHTQKIGAHCSDAFWQQGLDYETSVMFVLSALHIDQTLANSTER